MRYPFLVGLELTPLRFDDPDGWFFEDYVCYAPFGGNKAKPPVFPWPTALLFGKFLQIFALDQRSSAPPL